MSFGVLLLEDGDWTDGGIFAALGINLAIAAGLIIVFSVLRGKSSNHLTYIPRATDFAGPHFRSASERDEATVAAPVGFFGWVGATLAIKDEEIVSRCGLDSAMYVVFQRHILRLFILIATLSCCVLVPINNTGEQNKLDVAEYNATRDSDSPPRLYLRGYNNWIVTNLSNGSDYYWAHLLVYLAICTATYATVGQLTVTFLRLRRLYVSNMRGNKQTEASGRTVLIRNLPLTLEDPEELRDRVDKMVPGAVRRVWISRQMKDLLKLRKEETELMVKLDAARGALKKKGERPMAKVGLPMPLNLCCGKKVDALTHYEEEIARVRSEIAAESAKEHPTTGAAFVMMKTESDAKRIVQNLAYKADPTIIFIGRGGSSVSAGKDDTADDGGNSTNNDEGFDSLPPIEVGRRRSSESSHAGRALGGGADGNAYLDDHHEPTVWIAEMAPLPKDVIWDNLMIPESTRSVKRAIFITVTIGLVLLWGIPVGVCGNLVALTELRFGIGDVFKPLLDLPPVILGLLSTYLPVIVLIVFNAMLPMILTAFATQEGVVSLSRRTSMVLVKFYVFTLFSVVVIPSVLVGGLSSIVDIIDNFKDDPFGQILKVLSEVTAPGTSMYIGLLLSSGVIGSCVLLLQIGPLIVGRIKRMLAVTPQQKKLALTPAPFQYHLAYAGLLLGLSVTMLFSITIPITSLFGLIFIAFRHVMTKYSLVYIFQTADASDGSMTRAATRMLLITLAVLQAATVLMFLANKAFPQFGIALVFSFVSVFVMSAVNEKLDAVFRNDLYVPDPSKEGQAYASREAIATGHNGGISGRLITLVEGLGGKMLSFVPPLPGALKKNGKSGPGAGKAARQESQVAPDEEVPLDDAYTHPALINPDEFPEIDLSTTGDGVSLAEEYSRSRGESSPDSGGHNSVNGDESDYSEQV